MRHEDSMGVIVGSLQLRYNVTFRKHSSQHAGFLSNLSVLVGNE